MGPLSLSSFQSCIEVLICVPVAHLPNSPTAYQGTLGAADKIGFPFTKLDCEDGGEIKPRDSRERREGGEELMMSDDSRREIIPVCARAIVTARLLWGFL